MSNADPDNLAEPAPDTDALLAELEREVVLDNQMYRRRQWAAGLYLVFLLYLVSSKHTGLFSVGLNMAWWFAVALIFSAQKKQSEARRALIEKLKGNVRAVGGLMLMVLKAEQGDYKSSAIAMLKQMLPALRASDSQYLTPEHLTAMTQLLGIGDTELKLAI